MTDSNELHRPRKQPKRSVTAHVCKGCGATFTNRHEILYCTPQCAWEHKATGNHWPTKRGYLVMRHNGKVVPVHRVIMEQHLGRPLEPTEQIHHKDGDKTNNAIENLEILNRSEHLEAHRQNRDNERVRALSMLKSWARRYAELCDL